MRLTLTPIVKSQQEKKKKKTVPISKRKHYMSQSVL